jgi:hypothetical protein
VSQFRIFSHQELRRGRWLRRGQLFALLGLGWLGGTLMSQAHESGYAASSPLNRAVAMGLIDIASLPAPVATAASCPQLAAHGLRMDCRLGS